MKFAVERSITMEWMSQVHFPSDPRETRSRSWLSVSSLLEPRVVVSPSCSSDIHPKLVQSWSPPFRYSHLDWPSGVRGVVGMTNTVPFSLSVQPCSSLFTMSLSLHVLSHWPSWLASSSTEKIPTPECVFAALRSCLSWVGEVWETQKTPVVYQCVPEAFPEKYLSLFLPFRSSLSPLFSPFLFGLLPPLVDNHFTDIEPTLTEYEKRKWIYRRWLFE